MPDTTPTTELRAAAVQLRNPFHLPGLNVGIDTDLAAALADWLDSAADYYAPGPAHPTHVVHALAVARLVLGTTDQQPTPPPTEPCTEHGANCHTADWTPTATDPFSHEERQRTGRSAGLTEPTAPPADRRARYAAALATADGYDWDTLAAQYPDDAAEYRTEADAVMAVADAEQAELRAEADVLSAELTRRAPMTGEYANEIIRLRAEVERLRGLLWTKYGATPRRMADEAQQPETEAGRLPCSLAALKRPHTPHTWEPQPGMTPLVCPGTDTGPQAKPETEAAK